MDWSHDDTKREGEREGGAQVLEAERVLSEAYARRLPINASSAQLENRKIIMAGGGKLFGLHVYNSKATAQWIMLFDAQQNPSNGAVTPLVWNVAGQAALDVVWIPGRQFDRGCVICNSTTDTSLTLGANDCLFDGNYA